MFPCFLDINGLFLVVGLHGIVKIVVLCLAAATFGIHCWMVDVCDVVDNGSKGVVFAAASVWFTEWMMSTSIRQWPNTISSWTARPRPPNYLLIFGGKAEKHDEQNCCWEKKKKVCLDRSLCAAFWKKKNQKIPELIFSELEFWEKQAKFPELEFWKNEFWDFHASAYVLGVIFFRRPRPLCADFWKKWVLWFSDFFFSEGCT